MSQDNHYYAFGMKIDELSPTTTNSNRLSYNGKEIDKDLNWYHYGARFYDPAVGRWWVVDAADELYSPYSYVGNIPTIYIDPDGNFMYGIHWEITMNVYQRKYGDIWGSIIGFFQLMYQLIVQEGIGVGKTAFHLDDKDSYQEVMKDFTRPTGGLHTIQDFYAHSNYTELYAEYKGYENNKNGWKKFALSKDSKNVPTFKKVMESSALSDFQDILKKRLETTNFDGPFSKGNPDDRKDHYLGTDFYAKDVDKNPLQKINIGLAEQHSAEVLDE